jgi:hypothetical protein
LLVVRQKDVAVAVPTEFPIRIPQEFLAESHVAFDIHFVVGQKDKKKEDKQFAKSRFGDYCYSTLF